LNNTHTKGVTRFKVFIKDFSLPDVLYGCKTLQLTLREKHRLRVLVNRVMSIIFGHNGGTGKRLEEAAY
jgi:hypothetical protein